MAWLVALDPGWSVGLAVFHNRQLVRCARVEETKADKALPLATRLAQTRERVHQQLHAMIGDQYLAAAYCAEWPQIYMGLKAQGVDANDLLHLAAISAAVGGSFASMALYTPAVWARSSKKDTKKPTKSPRYYVISKSLDAPELALLPPQHDVIDATGIGLHHLGRLRFPRFTGSE